MNNLEKFLNYTGLQYFYNRIKTVFAAKADLDDLSDRVDEIIAEGGEPNVIETISVNGTNVPPTNKNIALEIPTATSDLTNDGDGESAFATEDYVDENGGKIDVIKVNGTAQTITNKEVDLTVPTKVSDLTNDSNFQTNSDVSSAISTALANSGDAYQTESDVDSKIETALTSAMTYKGSVATVADLPSSGNKVGDFYNVTATGENYAWDGSAWDKSGDIIDTSTLWSKSELVAITTAEIDTIVNA